MDTSVHVTFCVWELSLEVMVLMVMWLSVELLSEFVELLVIEAQSRAVRWVNVTCFDAVIVRIQSEVVRSSVVAVEQRRSRRGRSRGRSSISGARSGIR